MHSPAWFGEAPVGQGLLQAAFSLLKPGSFLWVKTDHEPYYIEIETNLRAAGFALIDRNQLTEDLLKNEYESTFERRFKNLGQPIFENIWTVSPRSCDKI